jgi:hypothetical protein
MSYKIKMLLVSSALTALALSTQVLAAEGKFDDTSCYAGPSHVIQHAEGITSGSYVVVGMTLATEGSPFHKISGRCVGTYSIVGGQYDENGTCEYVNAAGDKFFGAYARKGDPAKAEGTWHVLHGTGKFADMSMEGNWTPNGFPPFSEPSFAGGCNHEWGTYKLK